MAAPTSNRSNRQCSVWLAYAARTFGGNWNFNIIEQLVHQKKLSFYHRINNIQENSLIKQVFYQQKEYCSYKNSPWVSSLESINSFIKGKSKQIILDQADHRSKLQPLLKFKDGTNIENYMFKLPHKHANDFLD